MQLKTDLYIDGKWVKGDGTIPVIDPSNGEVIAEVATAGESQCDAAVAAADRAFVTWSKTAPRVRAEILRKAFELMIAESDHLAKLTSMPRARSPMPLNSFAGSQRKQCAHLVIFVWRHRAIREF